MIILDSTTWSTQMDTEVNIVIETYFSGHLYAHSAMETSDSCGNCDGSRCDTCKKMFSVTASILVPAEKTGNYHDEFRPIAWGRFYNQADAKDHFDKMLELYK